MNMAENKNSKLEEYKNLRETLDQRDETGFIASNEIGIDYQVTEVGLFLPSGTTFLNKLFEDLIGSGFINPKEVFLDAGSGDGRVNHIAALNGVEKSIGIEYSLDTLEKSIKQTQKFEEANIIKKGVVKLIAGDFTKIETYTKEKIEVESIKTFFNYLNDWRDLLDFVDNNSTVGTKIILMDEQFNLSDRVVEGISKFPSIKLVKVVKYIHWKRKDEAELLTPEILEELKMLDGTIENQHTLLDISEKGKVSVRDVDNHLVTTVYLCEKVSDTSRI